MATPPLGFIEPGLRTLEQQRAHDDAVTFMRAFSLPPLPASTGPIEVLLTNFLKDPDVIADMGMQFQGFRQLTGSCVGVTEGEGSAVLSAIQRKLVDNPTKAMIPWWPYAYGRTRYNEGDRGQGEGAVSSVMGRTLETEGTFSKDEAGLPSHFTVNDGLVLTKRIEMDWSDGGSSLVTQWLSTGKQHLFGARAIVSDTESIKTAIANGYPVLNGSSKYIGNASIKGTGSNKVTLGQYDGSGGHETGFYGYKDHPELGPMFLYWNHWDGSTYPVDPAGGPRCSTWVLESVVENAIKKGWIQYGEMFAVSHLSYFPAQVDKILDFTQI